MLTPLSELRDVVHVAKHWFFLLIREQVLPLDAHSPIPVKHDVLIDRLVEVNLADIPHWPPISPIIWRQRG